MPLYLIKRMISMLYVLIGVTIIVFLMIHLIPGDTAQTLLGGEATKASLDALRHKMGLDQPLIIQYFIWIKQVITGNLGYSYSLHINISHLLFPRFLNTLVLTIASLLLSILIGVGLGFFSGLKKNTVIDKILSALSVFGASMPVFWIALMLMWLFAIQLRLLPVSGMYNLRGNGGFADLLMHLILPTIATSLVSIAVISQMTRNVVSDVVNKDYINYYQSFGLSHYQLNMKHILRNSLPPVINIIGLQVGYILGGALFSEIVFNWPGVGLAIYTAINSKDYPMIQAGVLFIALSFVLVNFVVDILNIVVNPKLRDSNK
ncbi:ABC transporter permease [Terrilactibacillus laevilacticus]|uniref:ABC transporter permease n=1 Tax=Terrilactibacillus laevilacticus TaxID=1380157 RepID=A0ABW5PKE2_9BACI|nr:ABC transporter permease [Terrilactibacillus laevilacticus]